MAKPIFTQIIERARAYVAVRSHWTRYTLALTRNNKDCEPTDAKATGKKQRATWSALLRWTRATTSFSSNSHSLTDGSIATPKQPESMIEH